jgi:hypothetical protein
MPQPATHYLVTRRAIPQKYWGKWWDNYKPYFGLGSSAPDLFYFPLVPVVVKNIREDIDWASIANPLHASKSYDMFCSMLNIAKKQKLDGSSRTDKLFAFAIGYYCHVITDCVFHPYVYRSTGDYWNTVSFLHELKHKQQEFFIDTAIYKKYPSQDLTRIQWQCNEGAGALLDFEVARLFNQAMQLNYTGCYSPELKVEQKEHPIQQAYLAMEQSIKALFEGKVIYLFGSKQSMNVRDFRDETQEDFFVLPYPNCGTLNSYTPEDLFNFSSSACRKLFITALGFWESFESDSKAYFSSNPSHYTDSGNWNLDTGLPCQYNDDAEMRDESSKQYSYRADVINNTLAILQAEYNPADFQTTF